MDLRVASILLLAAVLVEATPDKYYHVKKQSYPTKSQMVQLMLLLGNQVHQAHQEHLALLAHQGHLGTLGRMVLDKWDQWGHLDHLAQQVIPQLVNPEAQVDLENQVHLDTLAKRDTQGSQELKVQEELQDHLEALDLLAFHLLESLGHMVYLDQWVRVESLALKVILEILDFRVRKGNLDMAGPENPVDQVQWVHQDLLVFQVNLELESLDQLDFLENLESQVCQGGMAHQVLWDYKVQKVMQGHLE
ncbi:hypothetical protein DNTS_005799 [Danionella cerebrum]|uniref:Uncharacterized protein n=1 Tax=Danionella cerebrum TaxID=2873325 RepID=A0A553PIZ6_9TELE|nr:hypothetical protein DNTS_005799 [Danionella translucida]